MTNTQLLHKDLNMRKLINTLHKNIKEYFMNDEFFEYEDIKNEYWFTVHNYEDSDDQYLTINLEYGGILYDCFGIGSEFEHDTSKLKTIFKLPSKFYLEPNTCASYSVAEK